MSYRSLLSVALTLTAFVMTARAAEPEITVEKSPAGAVVKIDGQFFTEYVTNLKGTPILWPVIGPTGEEMTRSYPMAEKEGERQDHPHHRSIWFNHGDVNGISFWDVKDDATIKHRKFVKLQSKPQPTIVTQNDWLGPDGKKQCEDERTITFGADKDCRWIDYDVTVKAVDIPVKFGDTKEGSFGIRVPATMKVDAKQGGQIVNSEGQIDKEAWAKRAAWVDYHGPVGDETVGIAILNHPSSLRFPTYWHVRTYGLFAANPFGLHDFLGSDDADGSLTLAPGESFTVRYRIVLHKGNEKDAKIAEAYSKYAETPK